MSFLVSKTPLPTIVIQLTTGILFHHVAGIEAGLLVNDQAMPPDHFPCNVSNWEQNPVRKAAILHIAAEGALRRHSDRFAGLAVTNPMRESTKVIDENHASLIPQVA